MSRSTIRVMANGREYVAGHDSQRDDDRILTFALAEASKDLFRVDLTGWMGGATLTTVSWTTTAGTLDEPAISGSVASVYLSGLSRGDVAEVKCTATAGSLTHRTIFRVGCPFGLVYLGDGAFPGGNAIDAETGAIFP
jgi:hypothetical protein